MATDLRGGGSFNSIFLQRSFLNLTVKKIAKIGPLLTKSDILFGVQEYTMFTALCRLQSSDIQPLCCTDVN